VRFEDWRLNLHEQMKNLKRIAPYSDLVVEDEQEAQWVVARSLWVLLVVHGPVESLWVLLVVVGKVRSF
jgi:hypothetical protein